MEAAFRRYVAHRIIGLMFEYVIGLDVSLGIGIFSLVLNNSKKTYHVDVLVFIHVFKVITTSILLKSLKSIFTILMN